MTTPDETPELIPGQLPPEAADLAAHMRELDALNEDPRILADLWRALADRWQEIRYTLHERKCRQREMHFLQIATNQMRGIYKRMLQ